MAKPGLGSSASAICSRRARRRLLKPLPPSAPPTGEPTKGDWLAVRNGRGARGGVAPRGARRRAPGERECQKSEKKKKKSRSFFLQISRQPRRVSGRGRDFQRARRPGLSGGPGIPSQSPESPGPAVFPGWGLARGGGPACSRIGPRRWWWCFPPA